MKKIIFFDIDGTLYDNKAKCVHQSTINSLRQLHQNKNIKIAIATGRAPFMMYSIEPIKQYIDYYVCINGQYIISREGDVLYDGPVSIEDMEKLIEDMERMNLGYGFEGHSNQAVHHINDLVLHCFNGLNLNIPQVDPNFYKVNNVYQMWTFCSDEKIEILKNNHPNFQFINWMQFGYDVLPSITSKGEGLKRLVSILGIDKENVYSFGDANNDIEMLKFSHTSVAMGNGVDRVKNIASMVTDRIENDGIYKALLKLKLIEE